jgi:cobalt-zinc-cadmium efflux system protein
MDHRDHHHHHHDHQEAEHGSHGQNDDHDHHHDGHHKGGFHHHSTIKNLQLALILNLSFALIELLGGIWTGSLAIVADAIHDFGDASALGLAIIFEYLATRRATRTFTYGYRRLSLVSAAVTALFLLGGSVYLITRSLERLENPQLPYLPGMLGLACLGVIVNGYAAWRLMRGQSLNEKVVSWHLMEDVFGWIAVLVGTLVMMVTKVSQIDAYLSLAFSIFIIWSVSKQFFKTLRLFMQGTPADFDQKKMSLELLKIPNTKKIHDIHLWSLDGVSHVLTLHVVVDPGLGVKECMELKKNIRQCLAGFGNIHATIEIEWMDETCTLENQNCHEDHQHSLDHQTRR